MTKEEFNEKYAFFLTPDATGMELEENYDLVIDNADLIFEDLINIKGLTISYIKVEGGSIVMETSLGPVISELVLKELNRYYSYCV